MTRRIALVVVFGLGAITFLELRAHVLKQRIIEEITSISPYHSVIKKPFIQYNRTCVVVLAKYRITDKYSNELKKMGADVLGEEWVEVASVASWLESPFFEGVTEIRNDISATVLSSKSCLKNYESKKQEFIEMIYEAPSFVRASISKKKLIAVVPSTGTIIFMSRGK